MNIEQLCEKTFYVTMAIFMFAMGLGMLFIIGAILYTLIF